MISQLFQIKNKKHLFELIGNNLNDSLIFTPGLFLLRIKNCPFDLIDNLIAEKFIFTFRNNENEFFIIDYFENINKYFNEIKLVEIKNVIDNYLNYSDKSIKIKGKEFSFNKKYIMGILNVTPDSFSDGGKYFSLEKAVDYASYMIENDIDIIDIGGESTRPNAEIISEDEEKRRVVPVIEKILNKYPYAIISVDTTKSSVAEESLKNGASIVNDISGLTYDKEMINIVKKYNAVPIVMHIQGTPQTMQDAPFYKNVVNEVYDFLFNKCIELNSIEINNKFIDPGIGFGKRLEDNINLLNRIDEFISIGSPLLLGVSRKSFIGKILQNKVNERDIATSIIEAISSVKNAVVLRTHNIENAIQLKKILNTVN